VVGCQVSPDGQLIAATDLKESAIRFYPLDGGPPSAIPGLLPGEGFKWTLDPRFAYVYQTKTLPAKIYRLNIVNGQRQLFKEINPSDETGICDMSEILFSADGRAYVYGYVRLLSELYLVNGMK
jgi:hypothetical protein